MATEDAGATNGSSNLTSNSDGKTTSNDSQGNLLNETMKCGWLAKRTKLSHKWERRWFRLDSNVLRYGNDAEHLDKNIPLASTEIREAEMDRRKFVFCLKPSEGRRTYYLQAGNQDELQEWMQAICFGKAASHHGEASQACSVQ